MLNRPLTLLDVYNAIDITEKTALALGSPFIPKLPRQLHDGLLLVITSDVLNVLSTSGVQRLLWATVSVTVSIPTDRSCALNLFETMINAAIVNGSNVEKFHWMPDECVAPFENKEAEHEMAHIDIPKDTSDFDILMRLRPFLETAHRSVEVLTP